MKSFDGKKILIKIFHILWIVVNYIYRKNLKENAAVSEQKKFLQFDAYGVYNFFKNLL